MFENQDVKTARVLLAEDDETNRMVILAYLSALPTLELTVVEDGRAALESATTNKFDLMIFDQNMPYITGDRVIRHLKASGSLNANTPVIRLSADTAHARDVSSETSRCIHLSKPLRQGDLVDTVKTLLTQD